MSNTFRILTAILACGTSLSTPSPVWAAPRQDSETILAFRQTAWERCRKRYSRGYCFRRLVTGGMPPPMQSVPPPPPKPCPDGSTPKDGNCAYLPRGPLFVFFDAGSDEITPQAADILDVAAWRVGQMGIASLRLTGHADGSEPAGDKLALSQRRAAKVREYLLSRGISDAAIETQAFGETRPTVQVPTGMTEPRNRRVEIFFGPGQGS